MTNVRASALWLIPGLEHPAYQRFSAFFQTLFHRYQPLDYRQLYLDCGAHTLRQRLLGELERFKPDLLLYSQFPSSYAYILGDFLGSLRARCHVVGIGFDDEMYFEQTKFFYQCCSAVITTDIAGATWLRDAGIPTYVTPLQSPQQAQPYSVATEDIDVSFVGDMTKPGRRDYVSCLEANGIPVADFGQGSRRGSLSASDVLQVFASSKINLNFTATNPPYWVLRNNPERGRVGQIKSRPFDLAALGRFCLCEWAPCVEHWFSPDVDIAVFHSSKDLVAQVRRYLGDDALRQRVAANALARYSSSRARDTLADIFGSILQLPALPPTRPPLDDPFYFESMGRSRGIAFLHSLRRGRPFRALSEAIGEDAARMDYWRGFTGGVSDTVMAQIRRS